MAEIRELDKAPWEEDEEEMETAPWEQPISGQDAEAVAMQAAERKYEEDTPGMLETAASQFAQGLSFGTVDEAAAFVAKMRGMPYDAAKDQINQKLLRQRLAHPGISITADILGSIVSSLIPGAGVATAPAKAGKIGKLIHGTGQVAKQAGIGMGEGFARGEGGLEERLKSGAQTSALAGGFTAGGKALGAGGRFAKGFVPGTETAPKFFNRTIAGLSKMVSKLDDDSAKVYQEMLDDPKVLQEAFTSPKQAIARMPDLMDEMGSKFRNIKELVEKKYDQKQVEAFAKNVQDLEEFQGFLTGLRGNVDDAIKHVTDPDMAIHYTPKTMKFLKRAKGILSLKDPKVKDLASRIDKLNDDINVAIKSQNVDQIIQLSKQYQKALEDMGGAVVRARRVLREGFDFKKDESFSDDQLLLKELIDRAQDITHDLAGGSQQMLEADRLYTAFKNQAVPFMDQFKGRGPDDLSFKKVHDFATGAGSIAKQAEVEAFHDRARDFLTKFGMQKEADDITKIVNRYSDLRRRLEMGRVGGQTGATTGRSLAPPVAAGVGAVTLGLPGVLLGVLVTPMTNPTAYARALNTVREQIAKFGESAVGQKFGKAWPAVKAAMGRRIESQEDVKAAADMITGAIGEGLEDFNQGQGLDTGRIPRKIREYFHNRGADTAPALNPRVQAKLTGQPDNRERAKAEISQMTKIPIPEDTTMGGRIQTTMDNLIGADPIGLDPGEKPSPTQPTPGDVQSVGMTPFMPLGTVTKLNPKVRRALIERKIADLKGKADAIALRSRNIIEREGLEGLSRPSKEKLYQEWKDLTDEIERLKGFKTKGTTKPVENPSFNRAFANTRDPEELLSDRYRFSEKRERDRAAKKPPAGGDRPKSGQEIWDEWQRGGNVEKALNKARYQGNDVEEMVKHVMDPATDYQNHVLTWNSKRNFNQIYRHPETDIFIEIADKPPALSGEKVARSMRELENMYRDAWEKGERTKIYFVKGPAGGVGNQKNDTRIEKLKQSSKDIDDELEGVLPNRKKIGRYRGHVISEDEGGFWVGGPKTAGFPDQWAESLEEAKKLIDYLED